MERNLFAKRAKLYHLPNLCYQCSRIDLIEVFKQADAHFNKTGASSRKNIPRTNSSNEGYFVMSFKEPLSQESQCPLCRFFLMARFGGENTGTYELRAFSSLTCTDYIYSNGLEGLPIISTQNAFLAVVPSTGIHNDLHSLVTSHGAIYRSTMDGASEDAKANGIWGREIGKRIDFSILREWMKFCSTHHRGHCVLDKKKQKPIFPAFRVINCTIEPPLVEAVSPDQKYVALSYVWGEDSCGPVWPRVVLDSIKVTRALGLNYLWVDRYCINQDDDDEKQYLISKMAWIYERAEVTIIAASGVDAHHGLPGVESTSRTTQPKIEIGNMTLVHTLADPHILLRQSKWWTRGWTYQEGVLSRRRLVFLEDQVYWECSSMVAHETVRFPLLSTHTKNKIRMAPSMRGGMLGGKPASYSSFRTKGNHDSVSCVELAEHVSNFTRRDLRYESDMFPAFEGISSRYSGDNSNIQLILGLPLVATDIVHRCNDSFALALVTWVHVQDHESPRRLINFPSWTWLGWKGAVNWGWPYDQKFPFILLYRWHADLLLFRDIGDIYTPDIEVITTTRESFTLWGEMSSIRFELLKNCAFTLRIKTPLYLRTCTIKKLRKDENSVQVWEINGSEARISTSVPGVFNDSQELQDDGPVKIILLYFVKAMAWREQFLIIKKVSSDSTEDYWERVGAIIWKSKKEDDDGGLSRLSRLDYDILLR